MDHYVEVTTSKGTELLLMRLTDAIAGAAPVDRLQIHRTPVDVAGGQTRPVSHFDLAALRGAGLLVGRIW